MYDNKAETYFPIVFKEFFFDSSTVRAIGR